MRRGALTAVMLALLALPGLALAAGDPRRGEQWGLSMVEADAAHGITRGAGATVAVIDTGVRATHQDLAGRVAPGSDLVAGDADASDQNGHGTHVAGIVAANAGNGIGVSSVAPGARILPVRVLDADGAGNTEDVAKGIDFAVDRGADVINLSLGEDGASVFGSEPTFSAAIDRALDAGRVVVAAAGNVGLPGCDQPSARGRLLCVGAVDRCGDRALYSNFGQGLGVTAPGGGGLFCAGDVLSTSGLSDSGYEEIAGTSQATPHVAGVAALLVARGHCGQDAVNRILATAVDKGQRGPDGAFGAGIVNARRAVSGLGQGPCRPGTKGKRAVTGRGGGGAARVSVKGAQRIRTVLRRGIKVRCRAAGAGTCRVTARRRAKRVAKGAKRLKAGRTATVSARMTKPGRRLLRRALRNRKKVKLTLSVRLPGSAPVRRKLTLRP